LISSGVSFRSLIFAAKDARGSESEWPFGLATGLVVALGVAPKPMLKRRGVLAGAFGAGVGGGAWENEDPAANAANTTTIIRFMSTSPRMD
jgi:hypothetical protein